MTLLDQIIKTKKEEVSLQKKVVPEKTLVGYPHFDRKCNSLKDSLLLEKSSGIIAEFKQKSPSKGEINNAVKVEEVTLEYASAGAAGISVLTDFEYFGGTKGDLLKARKANPGIPILRKDFMIDPYQLVEAKAFGADVILLIAACLEYADALKLARKAKELGLEVIMEVHDAEDLRRVNPFIDMVGVNNRNLRTFEVDIETSFNLSSQIPAPLLKISESGISHTDTIRMLKEAGFNGFLIGETFMKTSNPGDSCRKFISEL